jgi:hypothetical protein
MLDDKAYIVVDIGADGLSCNSSGNRDDGCEVAIPPSLYSKWYLVGVPTRAVRAKDDARLDQVLSADWQSVVWERFKARNRNLALGQVPEFPGWRQMLDVAAGYEWIRLNDRERHIAWKLYVNEVPGGLVVGGSGALWTQLWSELELGQKRKVWQETWQEYQARR